MRESGKHEIRLKAFASILILEILKAIGPSNPIQIIEQLEAIDAKKDFFPSAKDAIHPILVRLLDDQAIKRVSYIRKVKGGAVYIITDEGKRLLANHRRSLQNNEEFRMYTLYGDFEHDGEVIPPCKEDPYA